jgi:type II secretory pathway pseudopilin PulG
VELVIVVSLMVILISTVAPRLQPSASLQVQRAGRQLATHLEMARTQALAERMEVEVVFYESTRRYIAYADDDRDGSIAQSDAEMYAFQRFGSRELDGAVTYGRGSASLIPGDDSVDPVTLTDNTLTLSVQGMPAPWGTMGTVYLVHRNDPMAVGAVSIAASGSFKAWRWDPTAEEWR